MDANEKEPSQPFKNLFFCIRRSIRYHGRRQGFYRACQDATLFAAVLLSTSTIALFLESSLADYPTWIKLLPSVVTSVLVGFTLVYRVGEKACDHANFRRQFIVLEQRLVAERRLEGEEMEKLLQDVTKERLNIESYEPKVKKVLDTICHNELLRAMGYPKTDEIEIGFWQRMFAPLFDFHEYKLHSK